MRILLAESGSSARFALRTLLAQWPGVQVVGEATDREGLRAQLEWCCPDVVLLDWDLPGLEPADLMRNRDRGCCTIVLSVRPEVREHALAAGADLFVSKADPPERLVEAILSAQRWRPAGPEPPAAM